MKRKQKKVTESVPADSDTDRVNLGTRLREARKYINLSQAFVAGHIGIPRTALSQIESGRRKIDALELKKIADLYRHPVSYFTGETSNVVGVARDINHLVISASKLSDHDREELGRFAEYLHARAQMKRNGNG